MNILFINANLYGHINPTLGLVKTLTKRGNFVSYYCSESFEEQVKLIGAEWIGYSDRLLQFLKEYKPTDRHPFFMLIEYMLLYDEVVLPEILDMLKEKDYDMIICDSIFGGGCFLRQLVKIPVVISHSSFAMSHTPVPERMLKAGFHPQLDNCYTILNRICKNYQIQAPSIAEVFTCKGERNIVYTTCRFNGDKGVCEPEYMFAGPSMDRQQDTDDFDMSITGDRKIIYISLGSFNTDFIDFYRLCIQAFGDSEYFVYMSIGKKCDISELGDIPDNFVVKSFLPQLEILRQADAFITHAGFNSVNEALYNGVPMLALPMVNDQNMVAGKLTAMKLGLSENMKELTLEILRERIHTLMEDTIFRQNCMQMSKDMIEHADIEKTVIKLEEYANS